MAERAKRLIVLGSTGSIGTQTLDVVRAYPERFQVVGLAAGSNTDLLTRQIAEFRPRLVHSQARLDPDLAARYRFQQVSMEEMAGDPEADFVLVATAGRAGFRPTVAALRAGHHVGLANKEILVMAGEIMAREAAAHGAVILPVDSEHNALWQCLRGEAPAGASVTATGAAVKRLILTCSGGALRDYPLAAMSTVTPEQALAHPNWVMGKKITIDCATLINKGLEVIEAHWLFALPYEQIDVLIHRESVIHSLVEFVDGSLKAQLGPPDMRIPIQYALTYPERLANDSVSPFDLAQIGALHFSAPDHTRFPGIALAREAGRRGGTYPAVLAAADEVAVDLFLRGLIGFPGIARLIEAALAAHDPVRNPTLEDIAAADAWVHARAMAWSRA
jgi:1-deoxy-D-xylulose-5-phosphate reductoisomerase